MLVSFYKTQHPTSGDCSI
uniref:Uncharacterized protein n=1 Tax=Anguilla anguilla TaxID=7936 RepID=A0A0E9V8E8_ANGAN